MGSDYLFNMPSTLTGMARALDLSGRFTEYNVSSTPAEADQRAMLSDSLAVARDIADAARVAGVEK